MQTTSDAPIELPSAPARSIDEAVAACDDHMASHRKAGNFILGFLLGVLCSLGSLLYYFLRFSSYGVSFSGASDVNKDAALALQKAAFERTGTISYVILALCVLVFGVLMAIYRFHLNEIAKAEHYKLGFLRVRIAANNTTKGFLSEVRQALTQTAFDYSKQSITVAASKKIESPLPGHPTSDIAALIINKIFEQVEVRATTKSKKDELRDEDE